MEIVYTNTMHTYIKENEITGVYGDLIDLVKLGVDVEGIIYDDEWTVQRFLNGIRLNVSSRVHSIFSYLDLDKKLLKKKIKDLSKTDFKFVLLSYLLINNKKIIIFDYFDVGLSYKDQKKLVRIIRTLKNDGISILVISKNLVFLDQIVSSMLVMNEGKVLYDGSMLDLIKDNNKLIDEPEILKFINMANKKGAKLDYTLDSKELLKDIYRSVY